ESLIRKASPTAQFRSAHGGGKSEDRDLYTPQRGDGDFIGGLEVDFIVVNVAALGEQRRDAFGRVMRAAATDTDERLGLHLPGHGDRFLKCRHWCMRGDTGKEANTAGAEYLLDAFDDVRTTQD